MKKSITVVLGILLSWTIHAQQMQKPLITDISQSDISYKFSGNTIWEITHSSVVTNHETRESFDLLTEDEKKDGHTCRITDINEAGTAAIGQYDDKAAFWSKEKGGWNILEMPGDLQGNVVAMSDNGEYAVGTVPPMSGDIYKEECGLWKLSTGKFIQPEGIPELDMQHDNQGQNRFTDISPDGRYILGTMSFSYIYPIALFSYIYDRVEKTYHAIGFTPDDLHPWQSHFPDMLFTDFPKMSHNGKWVTGCAYMGKEIPGSEFLNEYMVAYRYNVETGEIEVFDTEEGQDIIGYQIDDNGNIFGATPTNVPLREWYMHTGKYWMSAQQLYMQKYGVNFYEYTGFDYTGTPIAITGDGRCMQCMIDPNMKEYCLVEFPAPVSEECKNVNLLGGYKVSPASGSSFTKLKTVDITFNRNVNIIAPETSVRLQDAEGNLIRKSIGIQHTDNKKNKIRISFRTQELENGKSYTVVIPVGTVSISEDVSMTNEEIRIEYTGRMDKPVSASSIYPEDGSSIAKTDYSSSPIMLTMDTNVSLTDTASAYLYSASDNKYICNLVLACSGNKVAIYPASTQYLFSGNSYTVVVEKGSIADIAGGCSNEEIRISYEGSYVREIESGEKTLFSCDFNRMDISLQTFMLYEGDRNMPATAMQNLEFDADNTPWNFSIRESVSSTDYCAASHSIYSPAGKSDDWMVIPQLYIPDERCILSFDAQSYRYGCQDRIKVIVFESDEPYNYLTSDIIERMRSEGRIVVNAILSPGMSEEDLSDEWESFSVSLAEYSGKNIYIAFLNDNENQSMVFVDNILVEHDVHHLIALNHAQTVIDKDSENISGTITINTTTEEYTTLSLTLKDGNGNVIDNISEDGLNLQKGDTYNFAFNKPLPLIAGETNRFYIETKSNGYSHTVESFIKNLMFETTKHIVLEEFTGADCGNCPMGILAIENLEKYIGDRFIPVSIHTYGSDRLSAGLGSYTTYLGLVGAPSGIINRNGTISYPMWQNPDDTRYYFSNSQTSDTWSDIAQQELETLADIDIDIEAVHNADNNTIDISTSVCSAINAKNLNLNVFTIVLEDNLPNYQSNYFSKYTDPIFGEWGEGGIYGQPFVSILNNDVARGCSAPLGGTGGYFPQEMKAGEAYKANLSVNVPQNISNINNCKVVVMLIDANTDKMINAARVKLQQDATGIMRTDSDDAELKVSCTDGIIEVYGANEEPIAATLYSLNGQAVSSCKGTGKAVMSTNGYKGSVIVKASTASHTLVKKVLIR